VILGDNLDPKPTAVEAQREINSFVIGEAQKRWKKIQFARVTFLTVIFSKRRKIKSL